MDAYGLPSGPGTILMVTFCHEPVQSELSSSTDSPAALLLVDRHGDRDVEADRSRPRGRRVACGLRRVGKVDPGHLLPVVRAGRRITLVGSMAVIDPGCTEWSIMRISAIAGSFG
jgi:hypothetical protein